MSFVALEQSLGEPADESVYDFERRAWCALQAAMSQARSEHQSTSISYTVPLTEIKASEIARENDDGLVTLPTAESHGKTLILLEPHCDDVALSVSGALLMWQRPVVVVTLFNRSRTVAGELPGAGELSHDEISRLRRVENEMALGVALGARCFFLDEWEEPWPWSSPDLRRVRILAERVSSIIERFSDFELVAPFGFSTHPDHYLTRSVADLLGCDLYWEDVGFYGEYARSVEDQEYGWSRWRGDYKEQIVSIDGAALVKMALLSTYQSQMYPPARMMSILRFNWAVATNARRRGQCDRKTRYAERLYRRI